MGMCLHQILQFYCTCYCYTIMVNIHLFTKLHNFSEMLAKNLIGLSCIYVVSRDLITVPDIGSVGYIMICLV
jgi:hypothetical protein